ncbi:hypothetical protein DPEC_G00116680 [Dallia pectoralis]|uniref:Uncharacterized protein n=1 Tax=Dallia pectoralis TaxID=75939 RepID=A0ACC2GUX3_DALPE|nr:hypothetical protein DPEC_G00116680 [Dallia pectoralis]
MQLAAEALPVDCPHPGPGCITLTDDVMFIVLNRAAMWAARQRREVKSSLRDVGEQGMELCLQQNSRVMEDGPGHNMYGRPAQHVMMTLPDRQARTTPPQAKHWLLPSTLRCEGLL